MLGFGLTIACWNCSFTYLSIIIVLCLSLGSPIKNYFQPFVLFCDFILSLFFSQKHAARLKLYPYQVGTYGLKMEFERGGSLDPQLRYRQ